MCFRSKFIILETITSGAFFLNTLACSIMISIEFAKVCNYFPSGTSCAVSLNDMESSDGQFYTRLSALQGTVVAIKYTFNPHGHPKLA